MNYKKSILFILIIFVFILIYKNKIEIYPITPVSADSIINAKITTITQFSNPNPTEIKSQIKPNIKKIFSAQTFSEQYCFLKKNYPNINLNYDSEYQLLTEQDNNENPVIVFHMNDKNCPKGYNSVLKVTDEGKFISYLNCESATKTDLFLNTNMQYTIDTIENDDPDEIQIAMIGYGYFLVMCRGDNDFYITRKGRFKKIHGLLMNEDGCFLSAADSPILTLNEPEFPDQNGCFKKSKVCLGAIDPKLYNAKDFEFTNKEYTKFNYLKYDRHLKPIKNLSVLNNAKENRYDHWSNDFGLVNWDYADILHPPLTCD